MRFTVYIEPVAKARARTVQTKSGQRYSFTPRKTEKAEWLIRTAYLDSQDQIGLMEGPVKLSATFYIPRPKSAPKKRTLPTTKPDLRNYLGTLEDALNKYLWRDDSQITTYSEIKKCYGQPPRIEIEVTEDTATLDHEM